MATATENVEGMVAAGFGSNGDQVSVNFTCLPQGIINAPGVQ